VAQAQPGGTERKRGDTVQVNVSEGAQPPADRSVPDVVGLARNAARDRLSGGLRSAGLRVLPSEGTYFVTADISATAAEEDGVEFCRSLPHRCGVVAVPSQVFYDDRDAGRRLVRFAFCKRPEVLDEAVRRLATLEAI